MITEPAFGLGHRVLYRGIMAEVIEVLVVDRDEWFERYQYRIETAGGNILRVEENDVTPYQWSFF